MARTPACIRALAAAAAVAALSCRENIAAPGQCPTLCPANQVQVSDTTLSAVDTSDVSIRGFVTASEGTILVASDLDSLKSSVLIRFAKRPSKWFPTTSDTVGVAIGSVDSVTLDLRVSRDTAAKNLRILIFRLPTTVDTTATYASVAPSFADSLLIDSIPVADSTAIAVVHRSLPVDSLKLLPADSGVVALGVSLRASAKTAVTISAVESGASPRLKFYVRGPVPQDTLKHTFDLSPAFDAFVTYPAPATPAADLLVGNIPSARSLIRFTLPRFLLDSSTVVRATLVLSPTRPATGRPRETFDVEARPIVRDFAGKSIFHSDTSLYGRSRVTVGDTAQITLEVARMLRFWASAGDSLPHTMLLRVTPEGGVLGEIAVASRTAGARAPFLRVTYIRPYSFGVP